jgi:carbon-monoxide dehydrogenase medium subunit
LVLEDGRVDMSVVAPRPSHARKAEEAVKGRMIAEKVLEELGEIAASESKPRDSIRGEAWYRRDMVKVLTKRALLKSIERMTGASSMVVPSRLW